MAKEFETFIWDEKNECMSEDEREALVSERIRKCVKRLYEKVFFGGQHDEISTRFRNLADDVPIRRII